VKKERRRLELKDKEYTHTERDKFNSLQMERMATGSDSKDQEDLFPAGGNNDDANATDEEAYLNSPWNVMGSEMEKEAEGADPVDDHCAENKGTHDQDGGSAEKVNADFCEAEETKGETEETKGEAEETKGEAEETKGESLSTTTATAGIPDETVIEDIFIPEVESVRTTESTKEEALRTMAAAAAIALDEVGYSHGKKVVDDDDKDWGDSQHRQPTSTSSVQQRTSASSPSASPPPPVPKKGPVQQADPNLAAAAVAAMVASARSTLELGRPVAAEKPFLTPVPPVREFTAPVEKTEAPVEKTEVPGDKKSEQAEENKPDAQHFGKTDDEANRTVDPSLAHSLILAAATDAAIGALSVPAAPSNPTSSKAEDKRSNSPGRPLAEIQAEKERSPMRQIQQTQVLISNTEETAVNSVNASVNNVPTETIHETSIGASTPPPQKIPLSSFDPLAPTYPESETGASSVQHAQPTSEEVFSPAMPTPEAPRSLNMDRISTNEPPLSSQVAMDKADYHPLTNSGSYRTEEESLPDDHIAPITESISEASSTLGRGPMWQRAMELANEEEQHRRDEEEIKMEMEEMERHRLGLPAQISMTITNDGNSVCVRSVEPSVASKKAQFSQSLMARTRSRADVDSCPSGPKSPSGFQGSLLRAAADAELAGGVISPRNGETSASNRQKNDPALLLAPKVARKRVKVVQLLVFGLLGIIAGFFGSIYVQFTCFFVSSTVRIGGNDQEFDLHYGLWKYSPIDSVFEGYTYCYSYEDDDWSNPSPSVARICGLIALVSGTLALTVLWTYLIVGTTRGPLWRMSVRLLLIAAICQSCTLLLFLGENCLTNGCSIGPGAGVSIVVTFVWMIVAYEMHHNSPLSAVIRSMLGEDEYGPFSKAKRWWDGLPINDAERQEKMKENVIEGFAKVNPLQAAVTPGGFSVSPTKATRQLREEHGGYYDGDTISALDSWTDAGTSYREYEDDEPEGWTDMKSAFGWKNNNKPPQPQDKTSLAQLAQKRALRLQPSGLTDAESARLGSRSASRSRADTRLSVNNYYPRAGSQSRDRDGSYRAPVGYSNNV